MKNEELEKVLAVAEQWTKEPFDAATQAAVKAMIPRKPPVPNSRVR